MRAQPEGGQPESAQHEGAQHEGAQPEGRSVLVYVHGGVWMAGDKMAFSDVAIRAAVEGHVAVVVQYPLVPQVGADLKEWKIQGPEGWCSMVGFYRRVLRPLSCSQAAEAPCSDRHVHRRSDNTDQLNPQYLPLQVSP